MAGFRIEGNTSGNVAEVDASNNLKVILPTTDASAGAVIPVYSPGGSVYKHPVFTDEGSSVVSLGTQLLDLNWNTGTTATWPSKIGTSATTLTKQVNSGYMRLNQGAATTTTTGIAIYSNRTVNIENGRETVVRMYAKYTNGSATNKRVDLGLGYYAFGTGQSAAMNEFIGFRWTTTGGIQAVVDNQLQ